jgi:hypothetical protein
MQSVNSFKIEYYNDEVILRNEQSCPPAAPNPMKMGFKSFMLDVSGLGPEAVVGFGAFSPKTNMVPTSARRHVEPNPVAFRSPGEHEE